MKNHGRIWLAGALAVTGLALSACATEDYVDQHLAAMNTKVESVDSHVNDVSGQVTAVNTRVSTVDTRAQSAQGRADSAYTLAQGKFAMSEVARDQVTFDTGKSALSDEAKASLTALAERLKTDNKNVYLQIRGHADVRGSKQANRQLGRERAGNVARFLADLGVPGNKMMLGSWGEDQPKADEKTAEAHAENRRVEIVVVS